MMLYIRAVCSGSSLSAQRNFASLAIQNVPSEESGQTAWKSEGWCTDIAAHLMFAKFCILKYKRFLLLRYY